jgi:hypothetical protein
LRAKLVLDMVANRLLDREAVVPLKRGVAGCFGTQASTAVLRPKEALGPTHARLLARPQVHRARFEPALDGKWS